MPAQLHGILPVGGNGMWAKNPTRQRPYLKVAANGTGIVESDKVLDGERLVSQSIAIRNRTGARGTFEVYLKHNTDKTFLFNQTSPAANQWYYYPYEQHLVEGETIEVEQASCLQNDELDLHIVGYRRFLKDETA